MSAQILYNEYMKVMCVSKKRLLAAALLFVIVALALLFAAGGFGKSGEKSLEVYFVDVGQGDCVFLRSPSGKTMLIDCGEDTSYRSVFRFLKGKFVNKIDVVIATHAHSDHIGGMSRVLSRFKVGKVYLPEMASESEPYISMIDKIHSRSIPFAYASVQDTPEIKWDDEVFVKVLAPFKGVDTTLNNSSIVLKITYGDVSVLLTGDAEHESEELQLDRWSDDELRADVIKLAHHGSATSTSERYLLAVNPRLAFVSLDYENSYGYPSEEVMHLLEKYGIPLNRTDTMGTLCLKTDGKGITVENVKWGHN